MTITFSLEQGRQPASPARRAGVVVILVSAALLVLSTVVLGIRLAPSILGTLSSPSYPIPSEQTLTLTAGPWGVFEQTGSQSQAGPVNVSTNRAPQLRPSQIRVHRCVGCVGVGVADDVDADGHPGRARLHRGRDVHGAGGR